jgi:hypothetical protein
MPKYDYVAMNEAAVVPDNKAASTATQAWLQDPDNVDAVIESVSEGKSLRRFCEARSLSYSAVQRALTGEALDARYRAAQEELAEHLLGEMDRISRQLEDVQTVVDPTTGRPMLDKYGSVVTTAMDPKAAGVILSNLQWRVTKLNQRRYSDKQVVEQHTFDHTKAHIEAVRRLGRMPRPALEGRAARPALTFEGAHTATELPRADVPESMVPR